jgi:hypothetical protein
MSVDSSAAVPSAASPRSIARWTGALFLATMILGIVAETSTGARLVVPRDVLATAANIRGDAWLLRLGFSLYLAEMACQVAMTVLFFRLLRPVSRTGATLALAFGLVGCVVKVTARTFYLAPLLVVDAPAALAAFSAEQIGTLILLALRLNEQTAGIALVFFGLESVFNGALVARSGFLPRALGLVSIVGGLGWLTFLSPPLGLRLFPIVALIGLGGGLATSLWLLVKGVDESRWRAIAGARAA